MAKYRTFGIRVTPYGSGKALVYSRRSNATRLLSYRKAQLLLRCDQFRTLNDLAAQNWFIAADLEKESGMEVPVSGSEPSMTPVERHLNAFVADGFLVSDIDLAEEIGKLHGQATDDRDAGHTITSIGFPTCSRPDTLKRAVTTYVGNATRFEKDVEFVVIDDSREARAIEVNLEELRDVKSRYGVQIRYAAREERGRYADEIARRTGISKDVLRFALLGDDRFGKTFGATRNGLLLDSIGAISIQADDDTVCRISEAPDMLPGLTLTSETDANALWFFNSLEAVEAAAAPVEADFLEIHQELLGRKLTSCMSAIDAADEDLDFTSMEYDFFENMQSSNARVALTFAGIAGESGAQYPFRFLRSGETLHRLVENEKVYRLGMRTTQMIKSVRRLTISDGAYCMSTNIGVDHRTLLPPFMPVLRNEDGVFGSLLKACFPHLFSGYAPYTVFHSPPDVRTPVTYASGNRFKSHMTNGLMIWLIMSFRDHPMGPDGPRNLRSLGYYLQDLGRLAPGEFAEFLRAVCWKAMSANAAHAERKLQEFTDAPAYWVKDVETYLQAAAESVVHPDFAIPSDLAGSAAERLSLFQELTETFGTLLIHWPDIIESAGELRREGRRLAEPL